MGIGHGLQDPILMIRIAPEILHGAGPGGYAAAVADASTRLCEDTCWTRNSIWSARILRLVRIRYSALFGTYGAYSSSSPDSSGRRLRLTPLHERHAVTTFIHLSVPPRDTGRMWSRVSRRKLNPPPQ